MNQELLTYFQRELEFLANDAVEFAQRHPESARFVDPAAEANADPHVERFIDGFALINASLQQKLDGSLPDIANTLLQNMFPHYQRPLPSMGVVQLKNSSSDGPSPVIPARSDLTAEEHHSVTCRFQTCYAVTPSPIHVNSAALYKTKTSTPRPAFAKDAASVLQLVFTADGPDPLPPLSQLRFFLQGGSQTTFPLYELLVEHSCGMLYSGSGCEDLAMGKGGLIQPVGFDRSQAALPWPARSPDAARVLTEFFHCPQKFLFVDLPGWAESAGTSTTIELFVYFNKRFESLEPQVSAANFQLNCTPIVNVFTQRAEPIRLSHDRSEYPVTGCRQTEDGVEILSVDRVTAVSEDGSVRVQELFAPPDYDSVLPSGNGPFCRTWRQQHSAEMTKVQISVADPDATLMDPDTWVLDLQTTCMNGDHPEKLPYRGNGPPLQLRDQTGIDVECSVAPSIRRSPRLDDDSRWCVGALLALQYLPLIDEYVQHRRLRETLVLHNLNNSPEILAMIDGLTGAQIEPSFEEIFVENSRVFCRGSAVTIQIDTQKFPGNSSYLFCCMLSEFLSRSCSFNSFCRLEVASRETGRLIYSFAPASGEQVLQAAAS